MKGIANTWTAYARMC